MGRANHGANPWANPWAGEVVLTMDGRPRTLRLTLGALAGLEAELGAGSLAALVERFEGRDFSTRDVLALLRAGARGGGVDVDPANAAIEGGPVAAAKAAAELLARSFVLE
ncbi:tail tube GTA-gp10-like protein [Hasllibacter halocynthiae]|uniref:Tail tube GTA-gp10-like protein n=1 Tax=Hasllibacter halocynthiae TaxID=595589 RepID=A0A2T0X926_9RHOB|nr:gene transfer agent family protein [Hasllibacter halocynthiae]PRY95364.1 tail tube GTA-gp10-like protein [Hasllibacter halocynthiae]